MSNQNKKKILIIEDESEFAQLLKSRLEANRFQVTTASDGKTGIKNIVYGNPDLVILDVMLPGIGGYEICTRIKSQDQFAHLPIIMLTARMGDLDEKMGIECGADSYIPKPRCSDILMLEIQRLLNVPQYPSPANR